MSVDHRAEAELLLAAADCQSDPLWQIALALRASAHLDADRRQWSRPSDLRQFVVDD